MAHDEFVLTVLSSCIIELDAVAVSRSHRCSLFSPCICRVLVPRFSTRCNRGPWPLLWPVRSGRHRSCRCSISGNYRTGASTTPPVARVLADPDGSSTSAIPGSVLRSSCKCLEVLSIFLFNSKPNSKYISKRRPVNSTVPSLRGCAISHELTVTS